MSDRRAALSALGDSLATLMGTFQKGRAALLQDASDGVEWPAHVLLRSLHGLGPTRASSVAERLHLDKSTVSRQVAALVRDGLLERQADPEDGRASILVTTEAGRQVIADHERRRLEFFDRMLADWDDADIDLLERLLTRFAADQGRAYDQWLAGRPGHHVHPTPTDQGASR